MKKFAFVSKSRIIVAAILSVLFVFYAFNFVARNTNIVASRTLGVQIGDYVLNFIIFFATIYLALCLFAYIYQKLVKQTK